VEEQQLLRASESLRGEVLMADENRLVVKVVNRGFVPATLTGIVFRKGDHVWEERLDNIRVLPSAGKAGGETGVLVEIPLPRSYDWVAIRGSYDRLYPCHYEPFLITLLVVRTVDSETGEGVPADLSLSVHSTPLSLTAKGPEYRMVLSDEDHTFQVSASATGYDPLSLGGTVAAGETKVVTLPLNYNPFDLTLPSTLTLYRPYSSQTYSGTRYEPYQATRVVRDSSGNPVYDTVKVITGYTWEEKVVREETYVSGYRYSYTLYTRSWRWFPPGWGPWKYAGSGTETFYSYKGTSFTTGGSWYEGWKKVYTYEGPVYATRWVEYWELRSGPDPPVSISPNVRNVQEHYEIRKVPRTETYTAYKVYRYTRTTYPPLPWPEVEVNLTVTPRNGYSGGVRLEAEGPGIGARLGGQALSLGSSASTSLYLRPSSPGSFTVTVRGRDNSGRLVETQTLRVDAIDPHPADTYSETFVGTTEVREYVPRSWSPPGPPP